jgi:AAA15 family ATPase/GTPase
METRKEDATRALQHFSLWLVSKSQATLQPHSDVSLTTSVRRISPHELHIGLTVQEINSIFANVLISLTKYWTQYGITPNAKASA